MNFLVSASSDKGIVKSTNQDSLMAKALSIDNENAVLAVLCDGVGGLSKGELASGTVVRAFDRWFSERFPAIFYVENLQEQIQEDWNKLLEIYNEKIRNYGKENGLSLGTTLTAILILKGRYYVINIGDSRTYRIDNVTVTQLTKDQTIVNYELEQGIITAEQAKTDSRNNILLQCVGATENLIPDYFFGEVQTGATYMLCSDGFRHLISQEEILQAFRPNSLVDTETMKKRELELIELNKSRMEKDNISVITIKTC